MIALDLTPIEEARISTVTRQTGLAPAEYVNKLVLDNGLPRGGTQDTPPR